MFTINPFDLVMVTDEASQATIIGQAVSRVTPEDTLMVRFVPGVPGTMREVAMRNVRQMSKRDQQRNYYLHTAQVKVQLGRFPLDMLRYDSAAIICEPIDDSNTYVVGRITDRKTVNWTRARWASFMCFLKNERTFKFEQPDELDEI